MSTKIVDWITYRAIKDVPGASECGPLLQQDNNSLDWLKYFYLHSTILVILIVLKYS